MRIYKSNGPATSERFCLCRRIRKRGSTRFCRGSLWWRRFRESTFTAIARNPDRSSLPLLGMTTELRLRVQNNSTALSTTPAGTLRNSRSTASRAGVSDGGGLHEIGLSFERLVQDALDGCFAD